jgi:hypothetical protein
MPMGLNLFRKKKKNEKVAEWIEHFLHRHEIHVQIHMIHGT